MKIIVLIGYIIYGVAVYLYLFHIAPTGIPNNYVGTMADPATYMTTQQFDFTIQFSRMRHLIFFLSTPFEWLVIFFFTFGGISKHIEEVIYSRITSRGLRVTMYYLMFALITFLTMLPFRFFNYQLARSYGTSVMSLPLWLRNSGIEFITDLVIMMVIVHIVLFFIRHFKDRWWIAAWIGFIPFAFLFMLIRPILIDPLYNDFRQMQNVNLEARILAMANEAGISADQVFEVAMSDRTTTINGYVTGIGPTARIVLWDTALEQLSEDEIMFLMAHEISHYVHFDVYRGIAVAIIYAFAFLYILSKVIARMEKESLKRIPVAFAVVSILLFAVSPATNWASRRMEVRADRFALELTQNPEAGISLFQTLSTAALNEVNPPVLVRIFRSTHPNAFERIVFLIDD